MEKDAMQCPRCGKTMNHHADKMIHWAPDVCGEVVEFHSCPNCGAAASRKAQA